MMELENRPSQEKWRLVVHSRMTLKDVHVPVAGTCEYVTLWQRGIKFAYQLTLK